MKNIYTIPLGDFRRDLLIDLDSLFPFDKRNSLMYYDGDLESHWIDIHGNDYINTFMDVDVSANLNRELLFKFNPEDFLRYQSGEISFTYLISLSDDIMMIDLSIKCESIYRISFLDILNLYDNKLPFGNIIGEVRVYDDYFYDTMESYLISKVRNAKIKSLNL